MSTDSKSSGPQWHDVNLLTHAVLENGATVEVTLRKVSNEACWIQSSVELERGKLVSLSLLKHGSIDALVCSSDGELTELVFQTDTSSIKNYQPRQSDRVPICGDVLLRRQALNAYKVDLFDLSPEGCRVSYVDRPKEGERVWVGFPGMNSIQAEVRWVRPESIGLSFIAPLHVAIFDSLRARLGTPRG